VGTLLLFAVPIGIAAFTLLLAGGHLPGAGVLKVGQVALRVLSPVLLFAAACCAARGFRAVRRLLDNRRARMNPRPGTPPIEQIAADLRRLLWQHDTFLRSNDTPTRARRLLGLEAAITDRATQAARALDVPHPDRPAYAGFDKPELRRLLRALAAEGLVLPPAVELLAPDSRF
jgi:hypothetical protein